MPSSIASDCSVSWRTDSVVTRSAPPSLAPGGNRSGSYMGGNRTGSYVRRNVEVASASNSGMKFQSWREPKPLRSRPTTAIEKSQPRPVRRISNQRNHLDAKVDHDINCIVNRLSTPTFATKMKNIKAHPKTSMLNMNFYSWSNMAVYRDYQKTLYRKDGTMRRGTRSGAKSEAIHKRF